MPELPEVETYRKYFEKHALGRRIVRVDVRDRRILRDVTPQQLQSRLEGLRFERTQRHGKHLFAATSDGPWLHLHFGMTGDLEFASRVEDLASRFARVVVHFVDGSALAYDDARLFGRVGLVESPEGWTDARRLGPDPLDRRFDFDRFRERITTRRGAIKAVLMKQEVIAGIGNLYADEALYQASIHPLRRAETLALPQLRLLYTTLMRVLRGVVKRRESGRANPHNYLIQHRTKGDRCPRCGGTIRHITVAQRTTYFCARHQSQSLKVSKSQSRN